jgi:hypothetical protein
MKLRAVQWFLLGVVILVLNFICGCASTESENESVRPWNTPTDWQNGMSGMNYQHGN